MWEYPLRFGSTTWCEMQVGRRPRRGPISGMGVPSGESGLTSLSIASRHSHGLLPIILPTV